MMESQQHDQIQSKNVYSSNDFLTNRITSTTVSIYFWILTIGIATHLSPMMQYGSQCFRATYALEERMVFSHEKPFQKVCNLLNEYNNTKIHAVRWGGVFQKHETVGYGRE